MRVIKKISKEDIGSLEDRFYTWKKGKREGKHVGWRAALDESPFVLKWFESQTNKADALRYLIEENILANAGIVDLAEMLPRVRNFESKLIKKLEREKKKLSQENEAAKIVTPREKAEEVVEIEKEVVQIVVPKNEPDLATERLEEAPVKEEKEAPKRSSMEKFKKFSL